MIAFNKGLLENTFLVYEAEALQKAGFINKKQTAFIENQLPGYSSKSNVLVRVGMFILGCFLFSSCCGFFALITTLGGNHHYAWTFFVYAIFGFLGLEFMIRKMKYYANGLDDAFLVCAQLCAMVFIGFLIDDLDMLSPLFLAISTTGILCCIRYVDRFSALIACFGATAFIVNIFLEMGSPGKSLLPFILMLVAFGLYRLQLWLKKSKDGESFYKKSLQVTYAYALILFYLSGNYLVVREATEELLHVYIEPGNDISLAFLFYGLTFLTPLVYLYFAFVKKDRLLLWIGMLAFGFSVFTIRYYYSVLPLEMALLLGGALLFGFAFFSMRKWRGLTNGVTFEPDRFISSDELLNAQSLALIQNYGLKPGSGSGDTVEFGEGKFGGGGSGENY